MVTGLPRPYDRRRQTTASEAAITPRRQPQRRSLASPQAAGNMAAPTMARKGPRTRLNSPSMYRSIVALSSVWGWRRFSQLRACMVASLSASGCDPTPPGRFADQVVGWRRMGTATRMSVRSARSWPQAASISVPRVRRIVALEP